MVRRVAATAALLGALTACTSLQHPKAEPVTPTPSSDPVDPPAASPSASSPAAEPTEAATDSAADRAEARALFRTARRAFVTARRGGFYLDFQMPSGADQVRVQHEGSYDLVGLRSDYTVTIDTPAGTVRTGVRSSRSDAWFSILETPTGEQPDRACWIHVDTDVISEVVGRDIPGGPGQGFPPEVLGILTGRVDGFDPNGYLAGTSDLFTVATLFNGQMPFLLGIPVTALDRVPVVFTVVGDEITGWTADLRDVVATARDAGYLPRRIRRELRRTGLESFTAQAGVELERTGDPWTYRRPPERATVEMTNDESFETAMRSCTGVGQSGA